MAEKLTINQWAEEDRPREKMMLHGVGTLSDAELLAILIGSGNTEDSAVELMRKVLSDYHNSLNELGKTTVDELCHYKGIGPAKAITILAASELGKRRKEEEGKERKVILSSRDVYQYFYPLMCDLPTEECWVLLLNQASKVIDRIRISSGGLVSTAVDVRCILREALLKRAVAMALCHNHPSGSMRPSTEDDRLTEHLDKAAKVMSNRNLVECFLIHKNIVCTFHIQILVWTTFHTYIFQFFTDVETTFQNVTINHIFQFSTHECVTFSRFYMQEVNTEIQFAVHTDSCSDFNVLSINHTFLRLYLIIISDYIHL
jgi:DNA repair protein RadC